MEPELLRKYLGVLGVSRKAPTLKALCELVAAHVTRIPFENISKLYYRRHLGLAGLVPLPLYLDGIERYHFGGTCYPNNFHLYTLLASLGYEVKLCSADMTNPDVHMVIMAQVEGDEYLVDGGYAAPFLAPLPRGFEADFVVPLGRDRYVLKPQDEKGFSRLELYRDGTLRHGYVAKPSPRKIGDFHTVIVDSFRPSATFMNAILLARFYPDRSVVIHNLTRIESWGTESAMYPIASPGELAAEVEKHFAIPAAIVSDAFASLRDLRDAWG
jgi:arylamine N-acetyltransferase